jgi:hypothetical protein
MSFVDNKFIVDNCINVEELHGYVDEIHIGSLEYSIKDLSNKGYIQLVHSYGWPQNVYIKKEEINTVLSLKFNYFSEAYIGLDKFFDIYNQETLSHNLNKIRHPVPRLQNELFTSHNKGHECVVDLNKKVKDKVLKFLEKNNIKIFDSIFFKWDDTPFNQEQDRAEIEKYIDYIIPYLDTSKTYFLSSNHSLFYTIFKEKFQNCFFIDRGMYDYYSNTTSNNYFFNTGTKTETPEFVDFNTERLSLHKISDYLAHIELGLICKSQEIIYITNLKGRNIISLFLWLPLLRYSIPVKWIHHAFGFLVERQYNFDRCLWEKIEELKN